MKIVVLAKVVPDTYGDRKLNLQTGLADREASESVLDEAGERALEVALSYADTNPETEVLLLSMGPAGAAGAVRKGLALGASSAVQIVDEALLGADLGLTAEVLAAALKRIGFDLVIAGNQSTDGSGGVVPGMLAELLDVPGATNLNAVTITEAEVAGVRASDGASIQLSATLPAVISITEALPEARFSNFKGVMAAKKKTLDTLSLSDLGIDAGDPGWARSIMIALAEKPPRAAGVKLIDDGSAGEKLAEFLVHNRLAQG